MAGLENAIWSCRRSVSAIPPRRYLISWIRRWGRAIRNDEAQVGHPQRRPCVGQGRGLRRLVLKPEKIELVDGKLLSTEEDRETLLALCSRTSARIAPCSWAIPRSGARLSPS